MLFGYEKEITKIEKHFIREKWDSECRKSLYLMRIIHLTTISHLVHKIVSVKMVETGMRNPL